MSDRTLREAADNADAAAFVARDAEVQIARELLDPETSRRILFVHGPGGIGKSALLREVGRIAECRGLPVSRFDARALPEELDRLVAHVLAERQPGSCIVIDEVDALGSRLGPLRDQLLDLLPSTARVVLAGRGEPDRSWRENGLDAVVVDLPLRPLSDAGAGELLARRGVDPRRVAEIVAWARGFPLALTVAASTGEIHRGDAGPAELEQRLTAWLSDRPILDVPQEALEVAAFARIVDARLLAAALPGRPTRDALRSLIELPVAERIGDAASLHTVLAAAIRHRMRSTEPRRAADLVKRIAEHLATRARLGDTAALIELSLLIEGEAFRRTLANEPSDHYYPDGARPGELSAFGRENGFDTGPDWPELLAWEGRGSGHSLVMRAVGGRALLFGVFAPVADLTARGPVSAALIDAAALTGADDRRSFAGFVLFADAVPGDRAEAARLGSGAMMRQHGVPDIRSILIHYPEPDRRPAETAAIANAVAGALARPVEISDFGPSGAVGFVEGIVLRENGFEPRAGDRSDLLADDDDPDRIARLEAALDAVFGSGSADRRQRRAIELVHLGSRHTEEECLADLHLSRRSWYRLLRTARERLLAAP